MTVGRQNHISVANIGLVTLTMILSNSTLKFTLTNTLYIPNLDTNLISLGVLHHKDTLV